MSHFPRFLLQQTEVRDVAERENPAFDNTQKFIELGCNIACCRKHAGLTQEQLAERAGISRHHTGASEAPACAAPTPWRRRSASPPCRSRPACRRSGSGNAEDASVIRPRQITEGVFSVYKSARLDNKKDGVQPALPSVYCASAWAVTPLFSLGISILPQSPPVEKRHFPTGGKWHQNSSTSSAERGT